MSARAASKLAWSLWALCLAVVAGGLLLGVASSPEAPMYGYWFECALISPTFATLGALIVSRRPGNVIGWIFLFCGVGSSVQLLSGQYATVALLSEEPSYLPAGAVAAWLSTLAQRSLVSAVLFLLLLFPTGRLPSPRWRPFAIFVATTVVIFVVSSALGPGPLEDFAPTQNPFGVEAAAAVLVILDSIGGLMGLACVVAIVVSLVWRFYSSRGEERLQMKWFVYAATLGIVAILFGGESQISGTIVWTVAPLSLPISAGIAILRYRLYDIDLLINRTLVYGSLTVTLVLVYLGSVVLLQEIVRALTGGESQLAIVASTLVIAALFNPLRRRIQSFIDRRFYRTRYDAAKTLEAFSARLRDETDV
ncbi:MAG TPA: hypothetical protein VHH10_02375, partial [Rubrobacteraceae bacterium]|nr:hypothetical protein [Rubrobacteraceae bacterium]